MIGKINDDLFKRAILPHTGAASPQVVVGPRMGVDAAVLKVGTHYMVVAEDPIFPGPTTTPQDYGWITVHIGASDVAVMGVKPAFMTYTLLVPPGTPEDYVVDLVRSISESAKELGISIVGGHTGYYSAVVVPTIGGITVWGYADRVITPAGAEIGDAVMVTKGAAIEAAAILAAELGDRLLVAGVPGEMVERARLRMREMSVVKDAAIATAVGGIHAMHDATEGGLARGLWEVAEASGVGFRLKRSAVPVPPDVKAVCNHFDLDPYEVISEGTLVLTCAPDKVDELLRAFKSEGLEAAVIGEVVPLEEGRIWVEDNGQTTDLVPPAVDRFWEVFFNALALKGDARNVREKALCDELAGAVKDLVNANVISLIPEIGANLAYALPDAQSMADIAAIPGRLLRFKGRVVALGEPEMGCSKHMASALLTVRKFFPSARCIINLRNDAVIRLACAEGGLKIVSMPEVPGYRQTDEDFDRDLVATLAACKELPQVIEIPDRINLERLILVLGENLHETVARVKLLAQKVQEVKDR